jgi:hypothetical protein
MKYYNAKVHNINTRTAIQRYGSIPVYYRGEHEPTPITTVLQPYKNLSDTKKSQKKTAQIPYNYSITTLAYARKLQMKAKYKWLCS